MRFLHALNPRRGAAPKRAARKGNTMTKAQIATLEKAAAILNALSHEEYDALVDAGAEPMTAEHALDEIIISAKGTR